MTYKYKLSTNRKDLFYVILVHTLVVQMNDNFL